MMLCLMAGEHCARSPSPSSGQGKMRQSQTVWGHSCALRAQGWPLCQPITPVQAMKHTGFHREGWRQESQHEALLHPFPKDASPALCSRPGDCQLVISLWLMGLVPGLYLFLKCWSPSNTRGFLGRKNKPQRNLRAIFTAKQSCLFLEMMLAERVKVMSL